MKISAKVECGIIALMDIAINSSEGKPVTANSIADRREISEKYLEHLLALLSHAKIIKGQSGIRGGYVLASYAEDISFKEVLDALDINILDSTEFELSSENDRYVHALNICLWNNITDSIRKCAEGLTLADAVNTYKQISGDIMYYI